MIKQNIIIWLCLLLAGCSVTRETFDCKYAKGVGCRSISEVNTMLNDGKLNSAADVKATSTHKNLPMSIKEDVISLDNVIVKRVTEEHLRIWLAPHQDEQGHFHEASVIHTVLRAGFWQVS